MLKVNNSFLENVLYDFMKNNKFIDNLNQFNNTFNESFFNGLSFKQISDIKKYYNLGLKCDNFHNKFNLKLCFIICDIIKNNKNNCLWCDKPTDIYYQFCKIYNIKS